MTNLVKQFICSAKLMSSNGRTSIEHSKLRGFSNQNLFF